MMDNIWIITLYGFLIGMLGTGLGGLASIFVKNNSKGLSFLLGITAGFMLYIVSFQLLPESFALAGLSTSIIGILLGILLVISIERLIDRKKVDSKLKIGLLLGISIAAHNFPEGLALGSSFLTSSNLGPVLALAMLVHNIPEGLSMALLLKVNKVSSMKIVLYTILAGAPTGLGAFIGAYIGSISNIFIALCLSFAAGAMLYMICDEILPNAKSLDKGKASSIGVIMGFIMGMLI